MKFTLEGVTHEFDPSRLTFAEGRAVERACGSSFTDATQSASKGDLTALQALIWVAMKRDEPTLTFPDLDDIAIADIEWEDVEEDEVPKDDDAVPSPSLT